MILAKNRNGRVGRLVPGPGLEAVVAPSSDASRRRNLYLNENQIVDDEHYYAQAEAQEKARMAGVRMQNAREAKANALKEAAGRRRVRGMQSLGQLDPMNAKLKRHFAKQMGTSETELVMQSLKHEVIQRPPDFASDSNKPEIVLSSEDKRPIAWRSDFRQHLIVGNPLTRDGVFGPAVTDYDRYVRGTDVNQENVVEVAGGTILGRWGGEQMTETWEQSLAAQREQEIAQAKELAHEMKSGQPFEMWLPTIEIRPMPNLPLQAVAKGLPERLPGQKNVNGMGWEMPSWGDVTDWAGGVVDQTVDKLEDQLPEQLAKELQQAILGGATSTTNPATGQITVVRPVPTGVASAAQSMGIPTWALYGGLGLMGVGVLLVLVKTLK